MTTWPLALDWRTRLPLGAESSATVPQFNLWTLRWNIDRIAHFGRDYWDAPIFAPESAAFARSEAQPLTGLLAGLLHPLGGDVGVYNLVLLVLLVTNGYAAMALARRLGTPASGAALVGVLAQTMPFTFNELGVLQLVPLAGFWWMLERIVAYRANPGRAPLVGAALAFACIALTSGYFMLFTAATLVVVAPLLAWVPARRWRDRSLDAITVVVVVGLLVGPLLWSQQANTAAEGWSTTVVESLSASPRQWIQHSEFALAVPWAMPRDGGQPLWPGSALLVLALAGVVTHRGRVTFALLGAAVAMFLLSLGLHLDIGGWSPYSFLRNHMPGFDRLRSPFRAAAITQSLLVALASYSIAVLWRSRWGRTAAVILVAFAALESVHWNQPTRRVPDVAAFDWVQWLDRAPPGAVAMVPFPPSGRASDYEDTTIAMLAQLEHGHPLVNGYTGFFPDEYKRLRFHMERFPETADESMHALDETVARYVVLRDDLVDHDRGEQALSEFGWRRVFDGTDRDVWTRGVLS